MDMTGVSFLLLLGAIAWFWFDSMRAFEAARSMGKQVCSEANVQFLDDSVARVALSLTRDKSGRRVLRRTYRFEFSDTGNSRIEGMLILHGDKIETVTMDPYQELP